MKKLFYPPMNHVGFRVSIIFIVVVLVFFWRFFLQGLLPIPADTIVGLYHPFRDLYQKQYPTGIPFKNFLITDPVRQQYPWRELAVSLLKRGQLPLWNPYTHAGTPLLGNLQSAVFYPFNIFFFILPFNIVWSLQILLQPLLAGLFLYFYLRHFNLRKEASLLGALSYSFSGFFIAWLEWNTLLHVALWLPLILLSLEKLFLPKSITILQSMGNKWFWIFVFSLSSALFAGHLQVFFYVFLISLIYAGMRIFSLSKKERGKAILLFVICYLLFTVVTSVQWIPTLKFINLSAREFDQADWQREGWFIPWQHLIQFFAPDFFGNPTTLNYWGVWNYAEMIGYIGILPLIMALFAMIYRHDKKTLFFGSMFFLSLIFATPTWFAKLPYRLQIPLISTSQPTRLLFLIDFSLAVLAALGFDYFLRERREKSLFVQIIKLLGVIGVVYGALWLFVLLAKRWFNTDEWLINLTVAKRNLILPTGLFVGLGVLLFLSTLFKDKKIKKVFVFCSLFFVVFDLLRFGWKFTPFTKEEYLFPSTRLIEFLQKQPGPFRIMATDKRILPPNFSIIYRLQTIDGYDPLYLKDYGELVAAWVRNRPDISPFSFNRILTPQNYESRIADLLNVKYVLSLEELKSDKLLKVFEEGETKVYENKNAYPRAFLVDSVVKVDNKQQAIKKIFDESVNLRKQAVVLDGVNVGNLLLGVNENVEVVEYTENSVRLRVTASGQRLLVLTDSYYPSWRVFVNGKEEKIHKVNYTFRGVVVPEGEHQVVFSHHLP